MFRGKEVIGDYRPGGAIEAFRGLGTLGQG